MIYPLLTALTLEEAREALDQLPRELRDRLDAMSPLKYLPDLHAPLLVLMHDRDDPVIPIGEAKLLWDALAGRPGVRCTEFTMFKHLDPTKVKLHIPQLLAGARPLLPQPVSDVPTGGVNTGADHRGPRY